MRAQAHHRQRVPSSMRWLRRRGLEAVRTGRPIGFLGMLTQEEHWALQEAIAQARQTHSTQLVGHWGSTSGVG